MVYGSLTVLYATHRLHLTDAHAYTLLGNFVAIAYISTIAGGYLADAILGYRHAIILGGILLILGYLGLGLDHHQLMYFFLSVICTGTGLFKANISSFLGSIYQKNDPRKDAGYTIFYVGISIGVTLSTALSGYLVQYFSWSSSFGSAGLLMIIGTLFFASYSAIHHLDDLRKIRKSTCKYIIAYSVVGLILAISTLLMLSHTLSIIFFYVTVGFTIIIIFSIARKQPHTYRKSIIAFTILLVFSTLFWAIYFQMFFSIDLFIDRLIDHQVLGIHLPTLFLQRLNRLALFF